MPTAPTLKSIKEADPALLIKFLSEKQETVVETVEHYVEKFTIGAEGGSAWVWRDGLMVGFNGNSRHAAVIRTAYAVEQLQL